MMCLGNMAVTTVAAREALWRELARAPLLEHLSEELRKELMDEGDE